MSRAVLDSSAVLALLHDEPGADKVWPLVSEAVISAVNAAEVQGVLVKLGVEPRAAWVSVLVSVQEVVAFDSRQAETAGNLIARSAQLGLSLGDRACIALASALQLPVYTADRAWEKLQTDVEIKLIR